MTTENNDTSHVLPLNDFKQVVQNAPLFAIDLVVLNAKNEVLLGERLNAPAQGFWFVPGGRVFKNESLKIAFNRISQEELGLTLKIEQASLLGLYDHFYSDSFFSDDVSTHYINATHVIRLSEENLTLPTEQHRHYRWVTVEKLCSDELIHGFSKGFYPTLNNWINQEQHYD